MAPPVDCSLAPTLRSRGEVYIYAEGSTMISVRTAWAEHLVPMP